jgi:hypothetical protein
MTLLWETIVYAPGVTEGSLCIHVFAMYVEMHGIDQLIEALA